MIKVLKPGTVLWMQLTLLAGAIFFAYARIIHAGFMNWDDLDYVFNTRDISSGISAEQVRHWFTRNYLGNYQPLVIFTYALDYTIGGPDPLIFHVHSLLWHVAATFLVFLFFNRLQDNRWIAFFVALLFAIHPVQTESVSWIAARNKSMNAVFYFSAMCLYLSYLRSRKLSLLVLFTASGFLAYLCKATALALPLALFAVDIWLRRPFGTRRVWLEKLPLLLAGIPIAAITLMAQDDVEFLHHRGGFGWDNIVFAAYALVHYVFHLFAPLNLSVLYPYPESVTAEHVLYLVPALAIVAFMVIAYRKGWHLWAGGILFFIVNLLPVLQLVQFGETLMANRYLYIAGVGLLFPLVYSLFSVKGKYAGFIKYGISTAVCVCLIVMTISRNKIWLSEIAFWNSVVDKFPESPVAQYSLGAAYLKTGDLASAERYVNNSVMYGQDNYKAWYNKATVLLRKGETREALMALERCVKLHPYPKAFFTRAMVFHRMNKFDLAIEDLNRVLKYEPEHARAYFIKADCLDKSGRAEEALKNYKLAIAFDDREPLFLIRRGILHAKNGRKQEAFSDFDKAVAIDADNGEAYYYRGLMSYNLGGDPCPDLRQAANHGFRQAGKAMLELCRQ